LSLSITGLLRSYVFLWDVRSGKLMDTLETGREPGNFITGLAAFPDGKRVICCAGSGLILWDLEAKTHKTLSLEEHAPVRDSLPPTSPPRCHSVAFTADGSRFATTVNDVGYAPTILVWDAKTCQVTRAIPMKSGNQKFAFAPDGTTAAADYYHPGLPHSYEPTVSRDVVGVWDTASGKKILAGRLFNWGHMDLAYTPDGKYLLAAGVHKDIIEAGGKPMIGVWDLATGKIVNSVPMPAYGPLRIAISPDNKLLAVPGRNIDIYAIEYTGK
jgi:WD40 repeat protein